MSVDLMEKGQAGNLNASCSAAKTITNLETYNRIEEAPTTIKVPEGHVVIHEPIRRGFRDTPTLSCISTSLRIVRNLIERISRTLVFPNKNQTLPRKSVVRVCKFPISYNIIYYNFLMWML
jgi:hypothetical protein